MRRTELDQKGKDGKGASRRSEDGTRHDDPSLLGHWARLQARVLPGRRSAYRNSSLTRAQVRSTKAKQIRQDGRLIGICDETRDVLFLTRSESSESAAARKHPCGAAGSSG